MPGKSRVDKKKNGKAVLFKRLPDEDLRCPYLKGDTAGMPANAQCVLEEGWLTETAASQLRGLEARHLGKDNSNIDRLRLKWEQESLGHSVPDYNRKDQSGIMEKKQPEPQEQNP